MKNCIICLPLRRLIAERRNICFISCWFCALFLLLRSSAAGTPGRAESLKLEFPPKPAELTNCPTIGQPEIELSSTLAEKLGGPDITNLLVPSIAHMLNQSERFRLTHGKQARCRCVVRLTDLRISQFGGKSKFDFGQAGRVFGSFFKGQSGVPAQFTDLCTNINWSSDKVQLNVRCAVSVEIIDTESEVVLAEAIGEEARTNTAKAIGVELTGLVYGKGDQETTGNNGSASNCSTGADYQTLLVQLASYRAICNLLPTLDKKLTQLANSPPPGIEPSEAASTKATPASGKLFCSNCGEAVNPNDKFCIHCGARVKK